MSSKSKVQKEAAKSLAGLNIYKDMKDRPVYYDRFSKTGYILGSEDDIRSYRNYSFRFALGIVMFVLINGYVSTLIAAAASIAAYAFMELKFRLKFLKGLSKVPNFKPQKRESFLSVMAKDTRKRIFLKVFLFLAASVLLVLNVLDQANRGTPMDFLATWVSYLLSVCTLITGCMYLYVGIKKKDA